MLENKHNLTVDTQSKSIGNAFVEVVQNDNVALEVQIYNNNLLVDNTAYTYTLLSVLPSKEKVIRQGEIGPNGYPVFYLGVEEMSEVGIILAMVQVFDELGNRVTSYDFKYRMKEDMSTGGVVPSADNPKFVIITEDSLNQTVQDAQLSRQELDEMKTDTEGVTHLSPNDRLVSDYNKINSELGKKADGLQEQLNQLVVNGDSSVEAAQARVNADGSVTYTTLKDRLDTEYNQLTAQLKDEFDNLQIGGVNLFDTSGQFGDTISNWYDNGGGISIDSTQKFKGFNTIKTVIGRGIVGKWYTLESNAEYTYAVMLKSDTSFSGDYTRPIHLQARLNNGNQGSFTVLKYNQNYTAEDIGKYKLLYLTFKLKDDANSIKPFIYYEGTGNPNINIAFMTLVKGNIPLSDWSPSPQDTQSQIDGLGNRVLMLEGKIEELEGRILSLEGV